jgi:hypothetical protein
MPPNPRPLWAAALFHALGLVAVALGLFVGYIGLFFVAWGAAACPSKGIAGDLAGYRIGFLVLGLIIAAAPAGWALLARIFRFRWWPWLAVAGIPVASGIWAAVTADGVPTMCIL